MKLKQWIEKYKNMSYAEYKKLSDNERYGFEKEYQRFVRNEKKQNSQNCRPMSKEEKEKLEIVFAKARERYETSLKIGGIDERGNYTALHHCWEE